MGISRLLAFITRENLEREQLKQQISTKQPWLHSTTAIPKGSVRTRKIKSNITGVYATKLSLTTLL